MIFYRDDIAPLSPSETFEDLFDLPKLTDEQRTKARKDGEKRRGHFSRRTIHPNGSVLSSTTRKHERINDQEKSTWLTADPEGV